MARDRSSSAARTQSCRTSFNTRRVFAWSRRGLLVALLLAHVGAALYHHFIRRDGLLRRMWYGR
ncbi:cytochrome b/b6 domain-containing protein [Mesorhizobium sp. CAU 1732]